MSRCLSKKELKKFDGLRVYVFKEIKNGVWTVWDASRKKKLFWTKSLNLTNASFFVDQDNRKKVIESGKRMPHAGVFGTLIASPKQRNFKTEVIYNPFLTDMFQIWMNGANVYNCKEVSFTDLGKVFVSGITKKERVYGKKEK